VLQTRTSPRNDSRKREFYNGGNELAQRLNDLDEKELQAFVGELSKHPDMLDLVLKKDEPSRGYSEFARGLSEDGSL
jgi:hypothetical protein